MDSLPWQIGLSFNQMPSIDNFAILNLKGFDYCCIISFISKNEAINLMQNADLTEKSETL